MTKSMKTENTQNTLMVKLSQNQSQRSRSTVQIDPTRRVPFWPRHVPRTILKVGKLQPTRLVRQIPNNLRYSAAFTTPRAPRLRSWLGMRLGRIKFPTLSFGTTRRSKNPNYMLNHARAQPYSPQSLRSKVPSFQKWFNHLNHSKDSCFIRNACPMHFLHPY